MEIYKLKDEIPEEKKKAGRGNFAAKDKSRIGQNSVNKSSDEASLIITGLKQGAKNPNRVNVFIDGKFSFSLDVAQVVDLGVKNGKALTAEELAELKKASEFGKLYQRTLEWVLLRPRSIRETRDYLRRKLSASSSDGTREDVSAVSESVIARLSAKGYLDDRRFAKFWAENRFVKKGASQKRLRMELIKKGIASDIIEEVLLSRDDEEEIRKIVAKKQKKYTEPEKLIAYLCRQGFSYDLARKVVQDEDY